ncbi:dehydratase aurZ [Colletotrichum liriopes]|uniref:Dehydratase aurZ n=1 Tax=Colletotrichum liriopes TaxID=708192 RepID=A0AA37GUB3_9PEZI|nr:dehydratase aurZ [Colletotrichum liriopes]
MEQHLDIADSPGSSDESHQPGNLICLTITAFRNPSLDEEEYRRYMTKVHAKLVSPLMEEYGILRYSMFSKLSEYDCIVQFVFKDIDDFKRMKSDARFLQKVAPDHVHFADTSRST